MDRIHDIATSAVLDQLAVDVNAAGARLTAGVFDASRNQTVAGHVAEVPEGFEEGFVLVLPGRQQSIPASAGGSPDLVAIVDAVCDWVMDELGHGWPELAGSDGSFVALLHPVEREGHVLWEGGRRTVPIGQLYTLPIVPTRAGR